MARPLILWLDDVRPPEPMPEAPGASFLWVEGIAEATRVLGRWSFDWASLDHDLGINRHGKKQTGYAVVTWMVEHNTWPHQGIVIHSWNYWGAERMAAMIDDHGPFDRNVLLRPAKGLP